MGGTRTYFYNLLDYYDNDQNELVVAVTSSQIDRQFDNRITKRDIAHIIIPERIIFNTKIFAIFPFSVFYDILIVLYLILKSNPDLIVFSVGTPPLFIGALLLPKYILYVLHTYPDVFLRRTGFILKYIIETFLSKTKQVVSVSNGACLNIVKYWQIDRKVNYVNSIHNFVKDDALTGSDEKNCILTLGHIEWYKNPHLWLRVANKVLADNSVGNVEFVWLGMGSLSEEMRRESQTGKNVSFVRSHKDIKEMFSKALIYFQPSLMESHGISVVEAMRYEIPCVVSNVGGLPESVSDFRTGFVMDVHDEEGMAEKLLLLIKNPSVRRKMGNEARLRYEELFTEVKWRQKMDALHKKIGFN